MTEGELGILKWLPFLCHFPLILTGDTISTLLKKLIFGSGMSVWPLLILPDLKGEARRQLYEAPLLS